MTNQTAIPRCGDHVVHRPTGELWLIAYAENDCLVPAGQPIRSAALADCDVLFRCSDDDHARLVAIWQYATNDIRREHVQRLYGTGKEKPGLLIPANVRRRSVKKPLRAKAQSVSHP